jgi:hypothetical protein
MTGGDNVYIRQERGVSDTEVSAIWTPLADSRMSLRCPQGKAFDVQAASES